MPKQLTYEDHELPAGGASIGLDVKYSVDIYNLIPTGGAITLSAGIFVAPLGVPVENQIFTFSFGGGVTIAGNVLAIFSYILSENEALTPSKFEFQYLGGVWVKRKYSVDDGTTKFIDGASIFESSITNLSIPTDTIGVNKLADTTQGNIIIAGATGIHQEISAKGAGALVMGTGTNVDSIVPTGDATIDGAGVITITNGAVTNPELGAGAVTVDKRATTVNTEVITVAASFETGEQGGYKVKIPFACTVIDVYAAAVKAIAATDTGTVVLKDDAGTTMTVTTPIVFSAGDAFGTAYSSVVTANNAFAADEILTVETAKTTAGGKVLVSLTVLRS